MKTKNNFNFKNLVLRLNEEQILTSEINATDRIVEGGNTQYKINENNLISINNLNNNKLNKSYSYDNDYTASIEYESADINTAVSLKSIKNIENNGKRLIISQNSIILKDIINNQDVDFIANDSNSPITKKLMEESLSNKVNQNDFDTLSINVVKNTMNINNLIKRLEILEQETIPNLENEIKIRELAVGSIIISLFMPQYGIWEDLGEILDGQTIIGGSSSDGSTISHNHLSFSSWYTGNADDQNEIDFISGFDSFDVNGNKKNIYVTDEINVIQNSEIYTAKTGGSKNKAYGIGMGLGFHIWKRVN